MRLMEANALFAVVSLDGEACSVVGLTWNVLNTLPRGVVVFSLLFKTVA